jgi:hypothetical protein
MPEQGKDDKGFGDLLRRAPASGGAQDGGVVSLTGALYRTEKEGGFVLALPGGQTVELEADAVQRFRLVQEQGPQLIVEIDVARDRIPSTASPNLNLGTLPTFDDLRTWPVIDQLQTSPLIDDWTHPVLDDPRTRPWLDDPRTRPWFDDFGTGLNDTWVEGIGSDFGEYIDPGRGGVINPQAGAGAGSCWLRPTTRHKPRQWPKASACLGRSSPSRSSATGCGR